MAHSFLFTTLHHIGEPINGAFPSSILTLGASPGLTGRPRTAILHLSLMQLKRTYFAILVLAIAVVAFFLVIPLEKAPIAAPTPSTVTVVHKSGPSWAYPDPSRTPGSTNPDIMQANIEQTICNPEWSTRGIRPLSSYTTKLKKKQLQELGLPGTPADYEEDHFISLELGGNATDPRNLWPQPYNLIPGARQKDIVENYLHKQVCAGAMTLREAQDAITSDWYRIYLQIH
jgi:hypothetical protein